MKFIHHKIFLLILIAGFSFSDTQGQTDRDTGIELYKKGDFSQAINFLERASAQKQYSRDALIWNYLGLAYTNQNKNNLARRAFEKAVKLDPQSSIYHANLAYVWLLEQKTNKAQSEIEKALKIDPKNANAYYIRGTANLWEGKKERARADADQAILLDPKFSVAYILQANSLLEIFGEKWGEDAEPMENLNLLENAAASLQTCQSTCPQDSTLETVNEKAESINAFINYFANRKKSDNQTQAPNPNTTPLAITFKPKPKYTDDARRASEEGDVRVAIMFSSDGQTKYLLPIKGLRYGLTEEALRAARQIKFEPQKVDGKAVSVVKIVVFTFDIY